MSFLNSMYCWAGRGIRHLLPRLKNLRPTSVSVWPPADFADFAKGGQGFEDFNDVGDKHGQKDR